MRPAQVTALHGWWLEEAEPLLHDSQACATATSASSLPLAAQTQPAALPLDVAQGNDEWIVRERSFSPFLDKERAAQSAMLESFRSLQRGWDSYDAEPPNDAAIAKARHVLHVLWSSEIAPPVRQISPSVVGGVVIVFTGRDKKYADIECFNNGDVLAITSDGTTEPSVWSLNEEGGSIRRAVEKLNAFFNG